VGDYSTDGKRGSAYGFRQSLGLAGSLIGAIIAQYLISSSYSNYNDIFLLSVIPITAAIFILMFFVKDRKKNTSNTEIKEKATFKKFIKTASEMFQVKYNKYWLIILLACVYMMGNYSGSFSILRSIEITKDSSFGAFLMIFQNLGGFMAAYPLGAWADKNYKVRNYLLGTGFAVSILSNLLFFFATTKFMVLFASSMWGIQLGITQSLFSAKIADSVKMEQRGSAFGIYYLAIGLMILIANTIFGHIKDNFLGGYEFLASSCFALVSIVILIVMHSRSKKF